MSVTGGRPARSQQRARDDVGGATVPAEQSSCGQGHAAVVVRSHHELLAAALPWLEAGIAADFGLVRAWKGDRHGNLVFNKSSRNFNPLCAMSGRVTIAEVEEIVPTGSLDPDQVHTPGIFVQRIVLNANPDKKIEQRTVRTR